MWYRFLPRRLDLQIALISGLIMVLTVPTYVVYEAHREVEYVLNTVKQQKMVLAQNVAITSVAPIVTRDWSSLEAILLQAAKFPGLVEIQITNTQGQIISDVIVTKQGRPEPRYTNDLLAVPAEVKPSIDSQGSNLTIWHPIESGSLIGWLKVVHSLRAIQMHEHARLQDYIVDATIGTLLLIGLIVIFLSKPLRVIGVAADFASRLGDKSGQLMPVSRRSIEIEKLINALNNASRSLYEQDGAIKGALKALETQKQALDEHSIVSITDVAGKITYANAKFMAVSGYTRDELLGNDHRLLNSGYHNKEFFREMWETISSGRVWHKEVLNQDKRGAPVWMNTTIVPFMDDKGKPYQYVAISTDITDHKNVERLLEEKNQSLQLLTGQLEEKVRQRTAALEKANQELLHLNNIKSEFVSVVSHELRTPLTSIKSFAEILEDDIGDMDVETQKHYLSIINEESDRLGRLINDVLDLQKIDSGKMIWKNERVNLARLLKSSFELFSKAYSDKGLELHLDLAKGEFPVDIDADRLKQVIANLLSNALKFTESGGVTVTLRGTLQKLRVLAVDDDTSILGYLAVQLGDLGVEVKTCEDGLRALQHLQADWRAFDMVITDIKMPGLDGLELLKQIRGFAPELPVLVMSGHSNEAALKQLLSYRVTDYLEKPIEARRLKDIIENAMGKALNMEGISPMVTVSVIDSGLGIPADEVDKVFAPFHQVDTSEERERGGSGLGLAISKEIVEHYGGHIRVQSKPGQGSCFVLSLPLANVNQKRLGEILIESGLVSPQQIEQALAKQG